MLDLASMALHRGEVERVSDLVTEYASWTETANVQATGIRIWAGALLASSEGRYGEVLRACSDGLRDESQISNPVAVEVVLELGCEAAATTADAEALAELLTLAAAAPIDPSPSLEAHVVLQRARLAALRGEGEPGFEEAVAALRGVGEPYWVATALLEQAEWLADMAGPTRSRSRSPKRGGLRASACPAAPGAGRAARDRLRDELGPGTDEQLVRPLRIFDSKLAVVGGGRTRRRAASARAATMR